MMTTPTQVQPEVADFAAAVRSSLADLKSEEVEELTDGLEADLAEQSQEWGQPPATILGDPAAYATELRTAAGLPPQPPTRHGLGGRLADLRTATREGGAGLVASLRRSPLANASLDFVIALRPVWWILRAWVGYEVAHIVLRNGVYGAITPSSPIGWVALLGLVVVSVQWGRGRWLPAAWLRTAVVAGSILAVVLLPAAIEHAHEASYAYEYQSAAGRWAPEPARGLSMNGHATRNVFAYDAEGRPLTGVQLFDAKGRPLDVSERHSDGSLLLPATTRTGRTAWNVFPLRQVSLAQTTYDGSVGRRVPKTGVRPQKAIPPLATAPALLDTQAPGADATEGVGPTAGPTPKESSKQTKPPKKKN